MKQKQRTHAELTQEVERLQRRLTDLKCARREDHRAEAMLEESTRRYQRLLDFLTDYVYTVKVKNGKVVETLHGPGVQAVTGFTAEEYEVNPSLWIQMVPPEDREIASRHADRALTGISSRPVEHRIIHKNGRIRWIRNSIVLNRDENGDVVSYDGLINDITQVKTAIRVAEERRQQLIQADKMATLGTLVAGVAHEINNPNNFIKLNTQMIGRAWEDARVILQEYYETHGEFALAGMPYSQASEKVAELIRGVENGARRIERIISALKDFSRRDTEKMDQAIDVNKVIEAATLILDNLIKKSTERFLLTLSDELPPVRGNFQKLEQVAINLIANACEALTCRNQRLSVRTLYQRDNQRIVITVKDEGVGIPRPQLKHIIDPFYTTKRETGGTGLGLSIAYNIIQDHAGEMRFTSKPGEGTTVTIRLPVY